MGKGTILMGPGDGRAPSPPTAEAAAFEYFHNRAVFGVFAPRPPIDRWSSDQRKRFEAELRRLERKMEKDHRDHLKMLDAIHGERS